MADYPDKKKQDNDWVSWVLIVILFAMGLSPIALIVLFIKLFGSDDSAKEKTGKSSSTTGQQTGKTADKARKVVRKATKSPKTKKSTAQILKIAGVVLLAVGVLACMEPVAALVGGAGTSVLEDLLTALAFAVAGGGMMGKGVSMTRALNRYSRYLAVLGDRDAMSFEEMARITGYSRRRIVRDLEDMIDKGYFGGVAYLHMEQGCFYRSLRAAEELQRKKAAEEAAKNVPPQTEEGYSGVLRSIRRANDRIADPVLSEKIDRLEIVTAAIFRAVEDDPAKQPQIATFLNYYLPTTQKLLDSYAEFEAAGVEGENLRQAKQRIEATMDSIIKGFEHQLDALYRSDAMDIDSDIRVMETMLRRERSSVEEDFGLGGAAVQQEEL